MPETSISPQNGSEAFSAVRARDVMFNSTVLLVLTRKYGVGF